MRSVFLLALAYAGVSRVLELVYSRRTEARLRAAGARFVEPDGMDAIVAVHAAWFASLVVEELWLGPTLRDGRLRLVFLSLFVLADLVRYGCMVSLGGRWSVRVVVLPGVPLVRTGLYRFVAHPIYAAVVVMLAGLPLALGLVVTPALIVPAKLLVLRRRIRIEREALRRAGGADSG